MIPLEQGCDLDPNRSEATSPSKLLFQNFREIPLFPQYENHRTLNTEKTTTMAQVTLVQHVLILDLHTLNTEQGAMILLYNVFYKGKYNFISLGKSIFILFQGLRKLILLKTKDRFKSLTIIGVMKIMCNTGLFKKIWFNHR